MCHCAIAKNSTLYKNLKHASLHLKSDISFISSPEQRSRITIVLPPASALALVAALALEAAAASTNVKVLR